MESQKILTDLKTKDQSLPGRSASNGPLTLYQNPLVVLFNPHCMRFLHACSEPRESLPFISCKRSKLKGEGDFMGTYFSLDISRATFSADSFNTVGFSAP